MLEKINKPNDIHKIALADFPQLADEIRQFLKMGIRDRLLWLLMEARV